MASALEALIMIVVDDSFFSHNAFPKDQDKLNLDFFLRDINVIIVPRRPSDVCSSEI